MSSTFFLCLIDPSPVRSKSGGSGSSSYLPALRAYIVRSLGRLAYSHACASTSSCPRLPGGILADESTATALVTPNPPP